MLAGNDGVLWLRRELEIEGGSRWTLVDRDGVLLGDARVPATIRMLYGDANTLYGIETDANDVPWVVRVKVQ